MVTAFNGEKIISILLKKSLQIVNFCIYLSDEIKQVFMG
jgi:hypothetical protein